MVEAAQEIRVRVSATLSLLENFKIFSSFLAKVQRISAHLNAMLFKDLR